MILRITVGDNDFTEALEQFAKDPEGSAYLLKACKIENDQLTQDEKLALFKRADRFRDLFYMTDKYTPELAAELCDMVRQNWENFVVTAPLGDSLYLVMGVVGVTFEYYISSIMVGDQILKIVKDELAPTLADDEVAKYDNDITPEPISKNDVITLAESSVNSDKIKAIMEQTAGRVVPSWIEFNAEQKKATIVELPKREEVDLTVQEHLIVELYSK
jgi:hypothetical protein